MEHGDNCEGCQKISFLALGPDVRKSRVIENRYTLVDIAPTVARLLQFEMDPVVVVPRPDTTVMPPTMDATVDASVMESRRIDSKMEPATMKGRVIKELFK